MNTGSMKHIGALVVMLIFSIMAAAGSMQDPKFETYTTENGLSHNGVVCILEDSEGFIWFGTWDGLNRFDGEKFIVYKSRPGDNSTLKNNKIREILEDELGYIWVKTYDKRIYRFDKWREKFVPVTRTQGGEDLSGLFFDEITPLASGDVWLKTEDDRVFWVSDDHGMQVVDFTAKLGSKGRKVNFIREDRQGNLWIGTEKGLLGYYKEDASYKELSTIKGMAALSGLDVLKMGQGYKENEFFVTTDGKIIIYDTKKQEITIENSGQKGVMDMVVSKEGDLYLSLQNKGLAVFDHHKKELKFVGKPEETFLSIFEDKKGNLWLEPEKDGAYLYKPLQDSLYYFTHKKEHNLPFLPREGFMNDQSFKVREDVNGKVWVSLKGGGFGLYQQASNTISYFYNNPTDSERLFSNSMVASFSDRNGVLWMSTREGGVNKISFFKENFKHQRLVDHASSRFQNEVRSLFQDASGRVWITNKKGDIYFYKGGNYQRLENNEVKGSIYCITEDRRNNIWIGTKGNGLFKLEPKDAKGEAFNYTQYKYDPKDIRSLSSDHIYSITEDLDGRLWISTFQAGLNLLVEDKGGEVHFKNVNNSFKNYPKHTFNVIRHAMLGPDGLIWLGTTDGLLRFNPKEDPEAMEFKVTVKEAGEASSLGNNDVTYLFQTKEKEVWVGTFGGGLNRVLNKLEDMDSDLKFKTYTTDQGAPNDIVLSILEDDHRNLWLSTENGISRFDVKSEEFKNYNTYNGLPKSGFSEAASLAAKNGELFFGAKDGFISFHPDQIVSETFSGNMVFTGLQLFNKGIDLQDAGAPLQTAINYADRLVLNYDQDVITIEYAVLDYRSGDGISYAYILEGYDEDWHFVNNQKQATYIKIPPGEYVFRVKAVNNAHFIGSVEKSIPIVINKPWWQSTWAYIAYLILALIILEGIRRVALTVIRLKHNVVVEKKMTELKLQFFTNISHELRTPLTLIVNPLRKIKDSEDLSQEGRKLLGVAHKNIHRMVRFVNQLLEFRKIQVEQATLHKTQLPIAALLHEIAGNFTDVLEDKKMTLEVIEDKEGTVLNCDREKMDIVFFNLLANAIKFSPDYSEIKVEIKQLGNQVVIQVIDQGIGVSEQELKAIFEPYYEGRNVIDSKIHGTGIGLALTKEIVKLHGGNTYAKKNEGAGLTVVVELPFEVQSIEQQDSKTFQVAHSSLEETALEVDSYLKGTEESQKPVLLLVEDNPELRRYITLELSSHYQVIQARDGAEGYEMAYAQIPDLILSDVMMPVMDGIEMLKKIKDNTHTSHIPIVLLTAKSAIEDQISGLAYGADFYMTKPFYIEYLIHLLANLLKGRREMVDSLTDQVKPFKLEPTEVTITSRDEEFLRDVIQVIEKGMSDSKFNIETVVSSMAMGRTTFYKKLKSLTTMSPVEFIKEIRLKRAIQLLDTGELTVSEVAYQVGFNSSGYFSTCFKEKYKLSPSEYLKNKCESV